MEKTFKPTPNKIYEFWDNKYQNSVEECVNVKTNLFFWCIFSISLRKCSSEIVLKLFWFSSINYYVEAFWHLFGEPRNWLTYPETEVSSIRLACDVNSCWPLFIMSGHNEIGMKLWTKLIQSTRYLIVIVLLWLLCS